MDFHVCIKQVPDVAAPIHSGRTVLNAYDASALEECLVMREAHGGTISVVLVGPESASETIRKALAMGADQASHLVVDTLDGLDSMAIATVLAEHFRGISYDVIACGKQSQDTDAGLTGSMLAALLSLPYVSNAVAMEVSGAGLRVHRQGDGGQEVITVPAPCLVTCSNDMNDPRIPTLKGIMSAKKKPVERHEVATVPAASTHVVGIEDVPSRQRGEVIAGEPEEMVDSLVDRLHNEARVV